MISLLGAWLLAAQLSVPQEKVVTEFLRTLTSGRIRTLEPLARSPEDVGKENWASLRETLTRYDCVTIEAARASVDGFSNTIVVDVAASVIPRNARRNRRTLTQRWTIHLDAGQRIIAVRDEDHEIADRFLYAASDEERERIASESTASPAGVARALWSGVGYDNRAASRDAAQFLLRSGDRDAVVYGWLTLAATDRAEHPDDARGFAARAQDAAHDASPVALAYANLVAGQLAKTPREQLAQFKKAIDVIGELDDPSPAFAALDEHFTVYYADTDINNCERDIAAMVELAERFQSPDLAIRLACERARVSAVTSNYERAAVQGLIASRAAHEVGDGYIEAKSLILNAAVLSDVRLAIQRLQHALEVVPDTRDDLKVFNNYFLATALVDARQIKEAEKRLEPAFEAARADRESSSSTQRSLHQSCIEKRDATTRPFAWRAMAFRANERCRSRGRSSTCSAASCSSAARWRKRSRRSQTP